MINLLWILIIQSVRVCVRALTSMSSVKLCIVHLKNTTTPQQAFSHSRALSAMHWRRQVVDLPGWGWSWVLIYTSPTSSHLLHSQQKQKVNNFLVKTRSSWLPAGDGREIKKSVEPGLLVTFHSIVNMKVWDLMNREFVTQSLNRLANNLHHTIRMLEYIGFLK